MEQLSRHREQLIGRLKSGCVELGQSEPTVLFCQVWQTGDCLPGCDQPNLRVSAQSLINSRNEVIKTYASLCSHCGIRPVAMELIGDCHRKGATRIIEDLEHAEGSQHPRSFLPGSDIPACSALFLPVFDLTDPFLKSQLGQVSSPTAVLEILVCETAKMRHNNSDLINTACEMLDKYQFGINSDSTAFKEWSKYLPARSSQSSQSPVRGVLSRASSTYMLYSDESDDSSILLSSPAGKFGKPLTGHAQRSISR